MKFKGVIIYKSKGTDDELVPIVDLDLENKIFIFVNPLITSELLNVNPTLNVKIETLIMKQYFYLKGHINLYARNHDIIDDDNYKFLLNFININNSYIDLNKEITYNIKEITYNIKENNGKSKI